MNIALIGRSEILYEIALLLKNKGNDIVGIVTAKEAPEYICTIEDFKILANDLKIPCEYSGKINDKAQFLSSLKADIAVSVNYTRIIPQSIIDLFPLGVLNAHGGDLPRYRGNACQAWAIINGEDKIGLCIHKMIGGELDSGDIISRDYLNIDHNTKITKVWEWMKARTPILMSEAISNLESNPSYFLEQQSKDPKDTLRCYPRKPEDGRIDWSQNPLSILRLINASNKPYSGAFCIFEDEKLIVWDAEIIEDKEIFSAVHGQVLKIDDGFIEVACSNGKLRLLKLEYKGKVVQPSDIIRSIRKRLL